MLGTFTFSQDQVISLEPYGSIPVLARGIRIVHSRPDYPKTIIFWCLGSREALLQRISEVGFVPKGTIGSLVRAKGFPIRWSAIAIYVVLWNGLLLLDRTVLERRAAAPGPIALLALLGTFDIRLAKRRKSSVLWEAR